MDHVGGLANLLWNMRKLNGRARDKTRGLSGRSVKLFIPNLHVWEGIHRMLAGTEGDFQIDFDLDVQSYSDGIIYDDSTLRVIALHNLHLGEPGDDKDWKSYSFRIEAGDRSVVFSGDVADIRELDPILDGSDLLLMETGHHRVENISNYLKNSGKHFGQLAFIHHGRAILADPEREAQKARDIIGERVIITEDGMTLDI